MPETRKKTNLLFIFFRISFVAVGIVLAIIWASREQRWRKLTEINPLVFACSLLIFIIAQIIIGLRWWLLLRSQSIHIAFFSAVRLHFLGLFYNNCMPGSVGGDLIRAWYVTKHTDKRFEAALSVFVDRIVGLVSTLIIAVFFYTLFLRGKSIGDLGPQKESVFVGIIKEHKTLLFWFIVFVIFVLSGFLLYGKSRAKLKKAFTYISDRVFRAAEKLKKAILLYCKKPFTLLAAFGLTVLLQIMTITGFWFVGRDLGISVSIKYYYVFFTLTWVLGAIPVSIGGAVVVEVMLMKMFSDFAGVADDSALLALALCQRFVWLLASLPGAAIHLFGAHLPKDFFIDYDRPIA
ncbi:MAG: flippase-like domain-containing protein [Sedimentisphaerales bacterium]|nr:flippase-like domain-containing protein [Sedimentisphaerales bacterium]